MFYVEQSGLTKLGERRRKKNPNCSTWNNSGVCHRRWIGFMEDCLGKGGGVFSSETILRRSCPPKNVPRRTFFGDSKASGGIWGGAIVPPGTIEADETRGGGKGEGNAQIVPRGTIVTFAAHIHIGLQGIWLERVPNQKIGMLNRRFQEIFRPALLITARFSVLSYCLQTYKPCGFTPIALHRERRFPQRDRVLHSPPRPSNWPAHFNLKCHE